MTGELDGREHRAAAVPAHPLDHGSAVITEVVTAVRQQLTQLTDPGQGPAGPPASRRHPVPGPAGRPTAAVGQMARIVDDLAAELARIDGALADEAHTASRYGVKIGTDGRPPPVPCGPPASTAEASERHWALSYRRAWERAVAEEQLVLQRAVSQLKNLCTAIEPPRPDDVIAGR